MFRGSLSDVNHSALLLHRISLFHYNHHYEVCTQIVKGHCRQSQDSLLSAIVVNVMQIEPLVPAGGKEMLVVGGGLFREV